MNALAAAHANPVRTSPPADAAPIELTHHVIAWLTPFALQGDGLTWIDLRCKSPEEAVRSILRRLAIPAGRLRARSQMLGDVALLRRMPADAPREYGPETIQPVAFVEGLSQSDIAEALDWISQGGGV